MKRHALLLMIIVPIIVTLTVNYSSPCYADKYILEQGDFVDYGYQLFVNTLQVETITEANAISINFAPEIVNPPGLFGALLGMKNGATKNNVIIPPEDGFDVTDPVYGIYAGETLVYQNLQIYEINHFHYTEVYTDGTSDFGTTLLIILGVVLGVGGVIGISYVVYRYGPKIFGKRCLTCKTLAVGKCKNCGESFCEKCFSNGCPSCKGRSLIRTK
ncbi:MAG: hypothetical protein GOP50_02755 [Candidatus Heimdallarchaeota archaeon]|nr:hypothetical protein [Candidatus Heimdallarchaeota archaeon]